LVGLQVPEDGDQNLSNFLKNLGYQYVEETNNTAYSLFLRRGVEGVEPGDGN